MNGSGVVMGIGVGIGAKSFSVAMKPAGRYGVQCVGSGDCEAAEESEPQQSGAEQRQ